MQICLVAGKKILLRPVRLAVILCPMSIYLVRHWSAEGQDPDAYSNALGRELSLQLSAVLLQQDTRLTRKLSRGIVGPYQFEAFARWFSNHINDHIERKNQFVSLHVPHTPDAFTVARQVKSYSRRRRTRGSKFYKIPAKRELMRECAKWQFSTGATIIPSRWRLLSADSVGEYVAIRKRMETTCS